MHDDADPVDGELIIAVKPWRVVGRSVWSFGVFAICVGFVVVVAPQIWHRGIGWMLLVIAYSLLFIGGSGKMAYNDLRSLRSRQLRLDSTGFELGTDRWAWNDLSAVERVKQWDGEQHLIRILVRFHPESSTGAAQCVTPINPPDFDTGGRPLEDILRSWLTRYGRGQEAQNSAN